MTDPVRLLRSSATPLAALLLRAGAEERPSAAVRSRANRAAIAAAAAMTATAAASAVSAAKSAGLAASQLAEGTSTATASSVLVKGAKLGVGAVAKWVAIGALSGALALSSLQGIIAQQATKPGRAVPALATNAPVAKPSPRSTSATPPAPELISSAGPTQPARSSAVEVPRAQPTDLAKPEAPARKEGTLLAAEVRFVEEGRAALQRAAFADALTQLAPYESLFPRQQLLTEVLFLRMEAFSRLGNVERARALAGRILALGVVGRQAAQAHEVLGR